MTNKSRVVTINPIELTGNWVTGFSLDLHTVQSHYLGDNQFGHPSFDTNRSELGDLLYRLKYKSDMSVLHDISKTVVNFIYNRWKISNSLNFIIPVPPSNVDRAFQPVMEIAMRVGQVMNVPITTSSLVKTRETPELKNIQGLEERKRILDGVFNIDDPCINDKNILVFDDLYRSGATLQIITKVLYDKGKVKNVYVLTLTKTRSRQ